MEIKGSGGQGGRLPEQGGAWSCGRVLSQKELWLDVEGWVSDNAVGLNFWVGGRGQGFWDLGPKVRGDLQVVDE